MFCFLVVHIGSTAGIALTGCSETESSSSAAFTGASGELVADGAYSPTATMISTPHSQETEDYISGRFG
ncbi:phosphate ABC transporter ATP-binding protein [Corynebacterium diphtheriae]